ncbi:MAG: patatin-like phospholipase family protein [Pseudomonadota bacterium]
MQKVFVLVFVMLLASCATYPPNPQLAQYNPHYGYRFENLKTPANSESLFVILTFSGGGTRAAALSYGVMEKLRKTRISWEGEERRLLDEVDVISSVSGGSFTAAYYGLFGDDLFDPEAFEKAFLYHNIELDLAASLLNPVNWFRLASPSFGRIDLAAELYDGRIFKQKTFADLISRNRRPFIILNATDITMGSQFSFIQDQFDLLCSDLGGVHVGRAVAASSAFPIAFPTLILNNYAGTCNFHEPAWIRQASKDLMDNPPRFNRARIAGSYLNSRERRYIHLLDGGVADNIALRGPLVAITSNDPSWSLPNKISMGIVKKLVVIVVDARTDPKTDIDKTPRSPGLPTIVDTIASVPMGNYSFDTVQSLSATFSQWRRDWQSHSDCQEILEGACPGAEMPFDAPDLMGTYAIYVGFDQIEDRSVREDFLNLPTTFHLKKEDVDKLKVIGPKILDQSRIFQDLCSGLKCHD